MLLSARMLEIVKHLCRYRQTTYKEIEEITGIKERNVRYDIERINEILMTNHLDPICKAGKGRLCVSPTFSLEIFEENHEFIYSQEERISLLLLYLLFYNQGLILSQISKKIQVSRSTVKNDFGEMEQELSKSGFAIQYKNETFILEGTIKHRNRLMVHTLKQYISIIKYPKHLTKFQDYVLEILKASFQEAPLEQMIVGIDQMLEEKNETLTDEAYNWYVANILCMIWFFLNQEIPEVEFKLLEREDPIATKFIHQLEVQLNREITSMDRKKMLLFIKYVNLYTGSKDNLHMMNIESIVTDFISEMSLEMEIPFQEDEILIEGLFNHICPLIQRIQHHVVVDDNVMSLLSVKNLEVYEIVSRVLTRIDILNQITNENEIAYLAIHFIASLKRINTTKNKTVLLVCGHGYGTTTLLKESLLSEYQVDIIDTIPKYKLPDYPNLDRIDIVITTMTLNTDVNYLQVSPILTEVDHQTLIHAGIPRRTPISNYYSINKSLDFLTDEDRLRVLDVIRKELGYRDFYKSQKITKLSDLLKQEFIQVMNEDISWERTIIKSCGLLEDASAIKRSYMETIFEIIEQNGFYSIIDGSFALIHGNCEVGVNKTAMSMIINKKSVKFGEKEVKIVFCLSSKDQKEHIPAIINLMKLEKITDFIPAVSQVNTSEEAYEMLVRYEKEMI